MSDDADYFSHLQNEANVTALDPGATVDIEPFWDPDLDGVLNPCEPAVLRATSPADLTLHLVNVDGAFVDDVPGSLSDGNTYFYRIDERGGPVLTITMEARPAEDTVRIHISP